MPKRIQRKRTRGWRMPASAVSVTRPGKWGNPFKVSEFGLEASLNLYRAWLSGWAMQITPRTRELIGNRPLPDLSELSGKDLACRCRLCEVHKDGKPLGIECPDCDPCHADILLELANQGGE